MKKIILLFIIFLVGCATTNENLCSRCDREILSDSLYYYIDLDDYYPRVEAVE